MISEETIPAEGASGSGGAVQRTVPLLVIVGVSMVLSFFRLGEAPLLEPDEPRYAQAARQMRRDHDWLIPHFNGEPRLVKPPLFYWLVAAAQASFGETAWAVRLWPALSGVGLAAVTYALGVAAVGRRAAFIGGLVLATTPLVIGISRVATPDMVQAFILTAALCAFWRLHRRGGGQWTALFFLLLLGVNAWAKNPLIGLALMATLAVFSAIARDWRPWRALLTPAGVVGIVLLIGLSCGWQAFTVWREAGALGVFKHETFARLVSGGDHPEAPWYYVRMLPLVFLPWTVFAPLALLAGAKRREEGGARNGPVLLAVLLGVGFVLLTACRGKLASYLLPLLPPLALLTGRGIDLAIGEPSRRGARAALGIALSVVLALWICLPIGAVIFRAKLPPSVFNHLLAASIFGLVALAAAFVAWLRRSGGVSFACVLGGVLIVYVGLLEGGASLLPGLRSSASLLAELRPLVRPDAEVMAYKYLPTGLVYYLDRQVTLYRNTHKLGRALPADRPYLIVTRQPHLKEMEQELGIGMEVVARTGTGDRDLVVVRPARQ